MIGAGFASGREIALYFGDCSPLVPLFGGILLGVFCYLFLRIGSETDGRPFLLWGKLGFFADAVIKISNLVTLCSMIAASELTLRSLSSHSGGGVITGIISLLIVLLGAKRIRLVNVVVVPLTVAMMTYLFFKEGSLFLIGKLSFLSALCYCSMNIIGGGYLVATMCVGFSKKDCFFTALTGGVVLTLLIMVVFFTIRNASSFDMPLIEAANRQGKGVIGNIIMYFAVLTTAVSSLSVVSENKPARAMAALSIAFVVSVFGFRRIVDRAYPILSALGGAITVGYAILYCKKRRKNKFPSSDTKVFTPENISCL